MKKVVASVVLIVALMLLLLPPVLGGIAKANLDDTLARAATQSAGVMDLKVLNYDRGWFASRAEVQISLTDAYLDTNPALTGAEPSVIELRDALANGLTQSVAIAHGPLFFTTRPGAVWARFRANSPVATARSCESYSPGQAMPTSSKPQAGSALPEPVRSKLRCRHST